MILLTSLESLLNRLWIQKEHNMMMADILIEWLSKGDPLLNATSKATLEMFSNAFYEQFQDELSSNDINLIRQQKPDEVFSKLDPTTFENNAYAQIVRPLKHRVNDWELTYETYKPFQPFVSGDVVVDPNHHFREQTPIGFFDQPFRYLVLKQHDVTWMSVTPFEIRSMEPILQTLSGTVVTLGLGLGYFAFMASQNPKVTHVTIIEKDATIIELFRNKILPFFTNKLKIQILQMDALEYAKTPKPSDHLFVDIYHTAEDGWPLYIQLKKLESHWPHTKWTYWLESSILAYVRRYLLTFLDEQIKGYDEHDYPLTSSFVDQLFHSLFITTKALTLSDEISLLHWLSDENIKKITKNV